MKKFEGSLKDEKMDKKAAKAYGMSKKAYEKSDMDKAADNATSHFRMEHSKDVQN